MDTTKKITKRDNYNTIDEILTVAQESGITLDGDISYDMLHDFVAHELTLLDGKAAAAQKRAAAKKEEGDALREDVYNALTNDFTIIDEIVKIVKASNPDVTRNMVTSRLSQLGKLERVEKTLVAVDGDKGRKVSAYRRV